MSAMAIQQDALLSYLWDSGALNVCLSDDEWEDILADMVLDRAASEDKETVAC